VRPKAPQLDEALGSHHAEFRRMATQGIDGLSSLAHQHFAMLEDDAAGLLVGSLDHDPAHGGTRRRLADCLGIMAVILGSLDERLDVLGRDETNLMAQPAQQAPPMV
jgi:hypothetical protein